jgi:hypothetical protein
MRRLRTILGLALWLPALLLCVTVVPLYEWLHDKWHPARKKWPPI